MCLIVEDHRYSEENSCTQEKVYVISYVLIFKYHLEGGGVGWSSSQYDMIYPPWSTIHIFTLMPLMTHVKVAIPGSCCIIWKYVLLKYIPI